VARYAMLGVAFLLALLGVGEPAPDGEAILAAIQQHYDAVRDLQAEFVQTSYVASVGRERVSTGTLRVMRPGLLRWDYQKPESRTIVIDRESLRIYAPEDQQLQIAPIASGAVSPTALGFLFGKAKLSETFSVEKVRREKTGEVELVLKPRQDSGFQSLELWVDPDRGTLRASVLVDLFGNRTRVRLEKTRENTGLTEEKFSFHVPEGTEVIDLR